MPDPDRLRIVVPTWSVDETMGGITTFLVETTAALQDADADLVVLCTERNRHLFDHIDTRSIQLVSPLATSGARQLFEQMYASRLRRDLADVLLVPSNVGLVAARLPQVVIVQAPLSVPSIRRDHVHFGKLRFQKRAYFRATVGAGLRRADRVVAVSNWLRSELLRSYRFLDPSRVHAVTEGVAPPPTTLAPVERADPPRILFVSTLFPYKGAGHLVEALGLLAAEHPRLPWRCKLVGRDPAGGEATQRLRNRAEELRIDSRVDIVGPVAHGDVWNEYAAASVFVYPSELETFGLPPLEAMAMGVPVVASTAPSVVEVVGPAATIVDPRDHPALAAALLDVLTSDDTRRRLIVAGRVRSGEFPWSATAAELIRIAGLAVTDRRRPADR